MRERGEQKRRAERRDRKNERQEQKASERQHQQIKIKKRGSDGEDKDNLAS